MSVPRSNEAAPRNFGPWHFECRTIGRTPEFAPSSSPYHFQCQNTPPSSPYHFRCRHGRLASGQASRGTKLRQKQGLHENYPNSRAPPHVHVEPGNALNEVVNVTHKSLIFLYSSGSTQTQNEEVTKSEGDASSSSSSGSAPAAVAALAPALRRQRSGRQVGEHALIDGFTCRPRQRGQGESAGHRRRNETVVPSTPSPPASDGTIRGGVSPHGAAHGAVVPLRPGLSETAASREVEAPVTVARRAALAPPPPWSLPYSVLCGLRGEYSRPAGHPLVAKPLTGPSLTPPLGGTSVCSTEHWVLAT